jgi:hypothetical protein
MVFIVFVKIVVIKKGQKNKIYPYYFLSFIEKKGVFIGLIANNIIVKNAIEQ